MAKDSISAAEARRVGDALGVDWDVVPLGDWQTGLAVELEHGSALGPLYDVTGDDLAATGRIALAHFAEDPLYYRRLERMEAEGEQYWEGRAKPSPVRRGAAGQQKERAGWLQTRGVLIVAVIIVTIVLVVLSSTLRPPLWRSPPAHCASFSARYST